MKKLSLQGKHSHLSTCVDDEDFEFVSQWKWYLMGDGYAGRVALPERQTVYLHKLVYERKYGTTFTKVDHKNRNRLDNRKENLRLATNQQNTVNCKLYSTNKSGYKGVHWRKSHQKWVALIVVRRKSIFLGYFDTPEKASKAYKKAASKYFGIFVGELQNLS